MDQTDELYDSGSLSLTAFGARSSSKREDVRVDYRTSMEHDDAVPTQLDSSLFS